MTDYCKVRLIGKMVSDTIEFTDWSKDNMDALLCCVQAVVEYDGGDYPPLFGDEGDQHLYMQPIMQGGPVDSAGADKTDEDYPEP